MQTKQKLFDNQSEAVQKKEVFSKVELYKKKGASSVPKEMQEGVIFVASNTKLMSKDGNNNVMLAIGLDDYDGKVDTNSCKFFRPTTFEELITAFKYTEARALEDFFRSTGLNNSNLNSLICCFLKCNLDSETVDVKALATTSLQLKAVVDEKSQQYYDEKVSFYEGKIQKYQSKIQSLRQEQLGKDEEGIPFEETECSIGKALECYVASLSSEGQQPMQANVTNMIEYINSVKEILSDDSSQTSDLKTPVATESSSLTQPQAQ